MHSITTHCPGRKIGIGDKVSLFSQFYSTVVTGITDIIEKPSALSGERGSTAIPHKTLCKAAPMNASKPKILIFIIALSFLTWHTGAAQNRRLPGTTTTNLEEVPYRVVPTLQESSEPSTPPAVGDVYVENAVPPPVESSSPIQMPVIRRNWFGSDFLGGSLLGQRPWGSGLVGSQLQNDSVLADAIMHGAGRQWWARAEYLVSWRRGQDIPALVTTSSPGTLLADAGVLGLGTTQILLGNDRIDDDSTPGGRIDFGFWMPARNKGIGARFLSLGSADNVFQFPISANDIVARPFFNADAGEQQSLPVNFPGSELGSLSVLATSNVLGLDVYIRRPWRQSGNATIDFLWGYQMSRIDESLVISSSSVNQDGRNGIPVGTRLDLFDSFETRNEFHGGMLGLLAEIEGGCWSFNMLAKVGLGNMDQKVIISGETVITDPSGGTVTQAGLLAASSNEGIGERDKFAAVPEFELRYNYHLNEAVEVSVGHSCIYWSRAVQPGNQIDLNVDVVNGTAPILSIDSDTYWIHALSMGVSWRF